MKSFLLSMYEGGQLKSEIQMLSPFLFFFSSVSILPSVPNSSLLVYDKSCYDVLQLAVLSGKVFEKPSWEKSSNVDLSKCYSHS